MNTFAEKLDPRAWVRYQDESLLVVDKPSGILSIPHGYDSSLPYLGGLLEPYFGKIWMVHRLDKETSGLLVLARNIEAHRELNREFREREVHKTYHCLVTPAPDWDSLAMTEPLLVDADREHRTRVDLIHGKPACTEARTLLRKDPFALLACSISTGLRHQIRAHLYFHGLHIPGDSLYAPRKLVEAESWKFSRMMLHSWRLKFTHPLTHEPMDFVAADPDEFLQVLMAD